MRLRSVTAIAAIAAILPMSLVGCGSDDETPGEPTEVENEGDVDELPDGDFVDPDLVTDDDDSDPSDPGDPGEAPGEAPPAGD